MKKKIIICICILLAIILLIPIPMHMNDGGTTLYKAILYRVEDVHGINSEDPLGEDYLEGTIVKILGIEVYNDVK